MKVNLLHIFTLTPLCILFSLKSGLVAAETVEIDQPPIAISELATYRGGFSVDDNIINIGISVSSALNGQQLLNSHIANLVIQNGELRIHESSLTQGGVLNIIQHGEGNQIQLEQSNAVLESVVEGEVLSVVNQVVGDIEAITSVIQNTVDNSTIGIMTTVDIDAPISGSLLNRQIQDRVDASLSLIMSTY